MFPKCSRKVDEELLETVRLLPCMGCKADPPNDPHHVTSKGAGGDDVWTNLMPLCRECHQEWHQKGPGYMIRTYPAIQYWLEGASRYDVLEKAGPEYAEI